MNSKINSRRSHHNNNNVRDLMYQMTTFEEEMDKEAKKRTKFDIKKYKNPLYTNSAVAPQISETSV